MTIQECYHLLGGDFEDVLRRLYDEKRVEKFAFRFLEDASFQNLCKAWEQGDEKEAFLAAHTIKGLCANLGFQQLFVSSSHLTEALRNGKTDAADDFYEQVIKDYHLTVNALKEYQAQQTHTDLTHL